MGYTLGMQNSESTSRTVRRFVRKNHIGTYTASAWLLSGAHLHAKGDTRPLAEAALDRVLANYRQARLDQEAQWARWAQPETLHYDPLTRSYSR